MWVFILSVLIVVSASVEAFMPIRKDNTPSFVTNNMGTQQKSLPTKLQLFKSTEGLEERIKIVQQNWENIKATDVKKFVADGFSDKLNSFEKALVNEILTAEKTVEKSFLAAEKAAEMAIAEDLKQGFATKNMIDAVDAAKALAESASISAIADSNAVAELSDATEGVRDAIKEAMIVVQLIADKAAEKTDGLKYLKSLDANMVTKLESSVSEIKKSIKTVESVAEAVGNVASKDAVELDKLELTSAELMKSIENIQTIAEEAVESNSLSSKVIDSLEKAASMVMEELRAVEEVATSIATVAQADAGAVASMEPKAEDVINYIKAIESAIEDLSNDPDSLENLKVAALDAVEKIKVDEVTIEAISKAVEKNAVADANAVVVLESADTSILELVKAMEVVTDDASALANLDSQTESAAESIKALETAASECTDCAIKALEAAVTSISVNSGSSINVGVIESMQSTGAGELIKAAENVISDSSNLSTLIFHAENVAEKFVEVFVASTSFIP